MVAGASGRGYAVLLRQTRGEEGGRCMPYRDGEVTIKRPGPLKPPRASLGRGSWGIGTELGATSVQALLIGALRLTPSIARSPLAVSRKQVRVLLYKRLEGLEPFFCGPDQPTPSLL
jgi:hypothetical protein